MENSGGEYWGILYRNYDYENAIKRPDEYSILTIEASGGIKFCPYCGAELALLWEKHPEELKDVIKRYQSYDLLGRS
ncbi:MAG: hypothetical protein QGG25_17450 [Phycisphaerae bacterium]|nr:hypothetical protein [Phycisphaerae bacterium]